MSDSILCESARISRILDLDKPEFLLAELERVTRCLHPDADLTRIERAFTLVQDLFAGRYPNYRGCTTDYHDLTHTTSVFMAAARLADGFQLDQGLVPFPIIESLCIAALLHDSGYIQEDGDCTGTGAKYTACHVSRSERFVRENASRFSLSPEQANMVALMIACTDLTALPGDFAFDDDRVKNIASILATADLIGQMADRAYLEKLLFLYYEFKEAGFPGYDTEFDILSKTSSFYLRAKKRLDEELGGLYKLEQMHFRTRSGIDQPLYMEAIERHMAYLERIIADSSCNFRKKLKRIDLEAVTAR